ncbi:MAG: MEDS domain-containing protein [Spirochaetes bacterium]|nr:MEDS domain-containing protein [Spirochaetota bacterium]
MAIQKSEFYRPDFHSLEPGHHLISIYESRREQMAAVVPFLHRGLAQGAKTVFVTHDLGPKRILDSLAREGHDVETLRIRGQLVPLRSDESYIQGGFFSADRALVDLVHLIEQTAREGWPYLCLTGEVNWALLPIPGVEQLWRYEAEAHAIISQSECVALCQYDLDTFGKGFQRKVVGCHSHMAAGTQLFKVH